MGELTFSLFCQYCDDNFFIPNKGTEKARECQEQLTRYLIRAIRSI